MDNTDRVELCASVLYSLAFMDFSLINTTKTKTWGGRTDLRFRVIRGFPVTEHWSSHAALVKEYLWEVL